MKPEIILTHQFVHAIPEVLAERTVYVSVEFATVAHKCCCGCGSEVVTPLTPTDWKIIFDGETISLEPSIGSWNLPCQAHYWIRRNRVHWARPWTRQEIEGGQAADARGKANHCRSNPAPANPVVNAPLPNPDLASAGPVPPPPRNGAWQKLRRWLYG
jgi:hypothetical protein